MTKDIKVQVYLDNTACDDTGDNNHVRNTFFHKIRRVIIVHLFIIYASHIFESAVFLYLFEDKKAEHTKLSWFWQWHENFIGIFSFFLMSLSLSLCQACDRFFVDHNFTLCSKNSIKFQKL